MNPFTDFLFTVSWFILLVWGIRTMARGWNLMSTPLKPENDDEFSYKVQKKTVTKIPHPEMADIKQGDELLVVRFDEPDPIDRSRFKLDSPELHNLGDPLHKSLQDRIDELNEEDEDDEEGGLIVRR